MICSAASKSEIALSYSLLIAIAVASSPVGVGMFRVQAYDLIEVGNGKVEGVSLAVSGSTVVMSHLAIGVETNSFGQIYNCAVIPMRVAIDDTPKQVGRRIARV